MVAASSVTSREQAVARVAYLTSDIVYTVQQSLRQKTSSSAALDGVRLEDNIYGTQTEIEILRQSSDPFLSVLESAGNGTLATVLAPSTALLQAIPHLYRLASKPVSVFVHLQPESHPDYSEIASIRSTGFTIFQASSLTEAQDLAIVARAVSIESGKGSIVFFESSVADAPIRYEDRTVVETLVSLQSATAAREVKAEQINLYLNDAPSKRHLASETTAAEQVDVNLTVSKVSNVLSIINDGFASLKKVTGRSYAPFEWSGPSSADTALILFGSNAALFRTAVSKASHNDIESNIGILTVRVYRPWSSADLIGAIPHSVERLAVLEQFKTKTTKWGPLFLDVLMAYNNVEGAPKLVAGQLGYLNEDIVSQALRGTVLNLRAESPIQNLLVGRDSGPNESQINPEIPKLESAYSKILSQLFGKRLHIANAANEDRISSFSTNPEFALGALIARDENRSAFLHRVGKAVKDGNMSNNSEEALKKWSVHADNRDDSVKFGNDAIEALEKDISEDAKSLLASKHLFNKVSDWIVGSDAWAYDIGNSGVHHLLATGVNANMLVIDSTPYTARNAAAANKRKKDIGLYAMNFGNAYVASVAVYSSYTQVLAALMEADKFDGPSVVLAYLPYDREDDSPVKVLQETKNAVETGYWPLYRYNPIAEDTGHINFQLDSERLRNELRDFLRRDNHLSQLALKSPRFAASLKQNYGSEVRQQQKRKAKQAFDKMLDGLSGPPLTVLYASDGGNAETLAKRLQRRAKARALKAKVMCMDDFPIEELSNETNVILVTATAGQGEFPQNGRSFWDAIKSGADIGELSNVNFAVFAMGDSHYWPRLADKHYYNKPGKDLDAKLESLGAKRILPIGMGDDQDPDGYETGYQGWEPELWKKFGVDDMDVVVDEPKLRTPEDVKAESNFLRGGIVEGLNDKSTGAISPDDALLTKFHGTYMQDDRDIRDQRKGDGLEPAYSFMIRCRLAGGVATPSQWSQMDDISDTYGNHTFKLTTRQTFQFHGVLKENLKKTIATINKALITTIAACGDVNRNVMCSTLPTLSKFHKQVYDIALGISDHLLPSTSAYHEIWLTDDDGKKMVAGDAVKDVEPMYGSTYLPRKYKIAVAVPPVNDVDVFTNDVGFIAIKNAEGQLTGFNISIGGGMGSTHNNKKTYPRTGTVMAYCLPEECNKVAEAIMICQRDNGDRSDRKHARLKYTVDDYGVPFFRKFVEDYIGHPLEEAKPFFFEKNVDDFDWIKGDDGLNHFCMFIENGRIEDTPDFQMKTGLREIAKQLKGGAEFRLTPNQHLMISKIADQDLDEIKDLLAKYKLDNLQFTALRLSSSACVAFPTCGLAMAESERYLPQFITKLEDTIIEAGLQKENIVLRMTGCPNGCARPFVAEIACVGKAAGTYNLYLGGGHHGERLNKLYKASLQEGEILDELRPMLKKFAIDRNDGEHFGDWVVRQGIVKKTINGMDFHDGVDLEDATLAA